MAKMARFIFVLLFSYLLHSVSVSQEKLTLRLDLKDPGNLNLYNFRMSSDPFKANVPPYPPRTGLDQLMASGSAQITPEGLRELKQRLKGKNFVDVDLRQESHGFADDFPVSWYADHDWANLGKNLAQVIQDENQRLADLIKEKNVTATAIKTVNGKEVETQHPLTVKTSYTEEDLLNKNGGAYYRLPLTDYRRPSDSQVDDFLQWVKTLSPNTWIHFHCEAGEGRTTTFLVMYDILKNAHQVGFTDTVKRQWLLGGIDLLKYPPKDDWKYPYAVERTDFLKKFHAYVKSDSPETWSKWISHQARQTL
jgi:hypothetical protein